MNRSVPTFCIAIAIGVGSQGNAWAACDAASCKYPTSNTITIFDGQVDFPCACVNGKSKLLFQAGKDGDHFVAVFGAQHPFVKDNRVHTESFNPSELIRNDTSMVFKYTACHLEDDRPNCMDPKLFVKPVSLDVLKAEPESVQLSRQTRSGSVKITNLSGATHVIHIAIAGSPGVFALTPGTCDMAVENNRTCEFAVGFSIVKFAAEAVAQVTFDDDKAVLLSIAISGTITN